MKYIIMADGYGLRWHNYNGIPKHLIEIDGETLLARAVRLIHERDEGAEIIITSHDPRYDIDGATRYEPKDNKIEIDRFTWELIEDNCCFLYGDTYYSDAAMDEIISKDGEDILFFGSAKSIVAIKVYDSELFRKHVSNVKKLYLDGEITKCVGWQVYQSFMGQEICEAIHARRKFNSDSYNASGYGRFFYWRQKWRGSWQCEKYYRFFLYAVCSADKDRLFADFAVSGIFVGDERGH